jgi:hypothetical protein
VQADIMVYAETAGNNQGLVKLFDPSQMAPAAGMCVCVVCVCVRFCCARYSRSVPVLLFRPFPPPHTHTASVPSLPFYSLPSSSLFQDPNLLPLNGMQLRHVW